MQQFTPPHAHILSVLQDLSLSHCIFSSSFPLLSSSSGVFLSLSALRLNNLMVWKAGCHFRLLIYLWKSHCIEIRLCVCVCLYRISCLQLTAQRDRWQNWSFLWSWSQMAVQLLKCHSKKHPSQYLQYERGHCSVSAPVKYNSAQWV